jgi:hypothetical protein
MVLSHDKTLGKEVVYEGFSFEYFVIYHLKNTD